MSSGIVVVATAETAGATGNQDPTVRVQGCPSGPSTAASGEAAKTGGYEHCDERKVVDPAVTPTGPSCPDGAVDVVYANTELINYQQTWGEIAAGKAAGFKASVKDPRSYKFSDNKTWRFIKVWFPRFDPGEQCPYPACPGYEPPNKQARTLGTNGHESDYPHKPGCVQERWDHSNTCHGGYQVRHWKEFHAWVWGEGGWVLDPHGYVFWDSGWVKAGPPRGLHCTKYTKVWTDPYATDPTCEDPGHLVLPRGRGYYWVGKTTDEPGDHWLVAKAKPGYKLVGRTFWKVHVPAAGEGLDCRIEVTPVDPHIDQPECTGPGESSDPVITPPTTEGIDYTVEAVEEHAEESAYERSALTAEEGSGGGYIVRAVAQEGYKLVDPLPAGWTSVSDTEATYQVVLVDPGECILGTEAAIPAFVDPTCDEPNAAAAVYQDTDSVDFSQAGDVKPGGTVVVTAAAKPGHALPPDADASWTHAFASLDDCVKGVESTRPKPSKQPTVLGTSAVVPTAVAAGLPGGPTSGGGSGWAVDLVGRLMMSAGLVLLLAGGWLGFGRRLSGAHKA